MMGGGEISGRTVLGVAASAAVPATLLLASAGAWRSAPPFGPPGLLIVHLVMALPLGWALAVVVARPKRGPGPWAWGLLGFLLAVAVAVLGPTIGRALDAAEAGFLERAALRSTLASILVVPWLVPTARRTQGSPSLTIIRIAGLAVAVLPPLAFAYRLTETRTAEAASHLDTGRFAKAEPILGELGQIGSWRPIAGKPLADVRRSVGTSLARLRREVRRTLSGGATLQVRLDRVFGLIQLDRLDEAEALLRPLVDLDPDAALLRASLLRDLGRWADGVRAYRRALEIIDKTDSGRLVTAYDGLAEVLRSAGRVGEVSIVYREAARKLPLRAGDFAFRTGQHELDAGRPSAALASLTEAVRLDPSLTARAESLFRQVRVRTPACLLPKPTR